LRYEPVEDIPNIETKRVDFRELNLLLRNVLTTTRIALNQNYNLKHPPDEPRELRSLLKSQLLIFASTHDSIHILIGRALRKKQYPLVADAASLVREQIEKVFIVALVLSSPHKWIKQALRGSFRTDYEEYLLRMEEQGREPRFHQHLHKEYPQFFEGLQRHRVSRTRTEIIVSDYAVRVLEYNWDNPRGANPPWFRQVRRGNRRRLRQYANVREYMRYYFEFPTPGKALSYIKNKDVRLFLSRWHKDYSFICQYSHVAIGKAVLPEMSRVRHLEVVEKTGIYSQHLWERVLMTSFTATASACTLIVAQLRDSYGAKSALKDLWDELESSSLLSRAYWNMYPKKILK